MIAISFLRIVYPQLRPPQKNNNFDSVSFFLEKLENYQLVETACSSTHNDIYEEKQNKKFVMWVIFF